MLLGIDTGGTYTDAVLFDEDRGVLASAKALTTRHDLAIGILDAVRRVLADSHQDPAALGMVSLSTTLATNALVEGQGGHVALVLAGFEASAETRAGLAEALRGDPIIRISGGHKGDGSPRAPLDLDALEAAVAALDKPVEAFAVASMFAVRNPEHEVAIRERLRNLTGRPVTCSHELSSRLDGPRRAMTGVLNARLLPMIDQLLTSADRAFAELGVVAPLMVVRGDGALVRAAVARERPVETILSGPAASLVGAAWLADAPDAMVSDIGGTTTDYAMLLGGRPALDAQGATVGGFHTMVEAVAMRTIGLGGDSEVTVRTEGLSHSLVLGPRRVVPISLLAVDHPALVRSTLERQTSALHRGETVGVFVLPGRELDATVRLNEREQELLERLAGEARALDRYLRGQRELGTVRHLVARGLLRLASVTPSDAAHVLGLHDAWDAEMARQAMSLFAATKDAAGLAIAEDAEAVARAILEALAMRSAEALLAAACDLDGFGLADLPARLLQAGPLPAGAHVQFSVALARPLVGLGASAHVHYPRVAELLSTECLVPPHAEVANAVGAVVGRIRIRREATITCPTEGVYRVFAGAEPSDYPSLEAAVSVARDALDARAREDAGTAGADDVEIGFEREDRTAVVEGRETLVESRLAAVATGRPRLMRATRQDA